MKGGYETVADIKDALIDALDENVELTHKLRLALAAKEDAEAKLCKAREIYRHYFGRQSWRTAFMDQIENALSSSAPCRHSAIAQRAADTEGMAKALYENRPLPTGEMAHENIKEEWSWEGLPDYLRDPLMDDALVVQKYLREG